MSGLALLVMNNNFAAKLWKIDGNQLTDIKTDLPVDQGMYSPDGKTILTISSTVLSSTAKLWNIEGKLLTELKGNGSSFHTPGSAVR